ncbi:MAG: hypothetical protein MPEBLZ_01818 [Candidatus Methanoperedens nitroreducens]|uniref:Uncharacterized protein n=1 Tax=Candidatus Methanoperedens nitratireducens TaxID=1392998 RepID=A0A0N8KR10_9EURY|nr:hypothetical protein [Candidatus Methanoperedens sp. BLZ2]KAB2948439.1 MAG: hypothetical protein F9K14_01010 [Candidatus Methanoperedens sp.]KPQ43634.1 MAG: hypothetical protein MPEBLZ_01818 [Candidatus Methanoperedens sp. BLZ1]MBZ0174469.1 hypothetical protein [Candidatus Methanoperedens nitroreducens]MCX9078491.1 hypothetical protein [Candidatus Methanoperedens sp.]
MFNENWDFFISIVTKQEDIDEIERNELLRNWGYLRKFLGEEWFKKEENKSHPLMDYFYNNAPWCLKWVGELGLAIESLNKKENFDQIKKRLFLSNDFEETYSELRIGYSLLNSGFSFEFLKPSKIKKKKTPDIVINMDNREIFLEITTKNNPEDPLKSLQNFQKISWFFLSKDYTITNNLLFYFDILRPLSTPRTHQIIKICGDLLEKAKKSGFEEYHEPNIIDIYICKNENVDKVPKEKRVMQGRTSEFDEFSRIKGTIKSKEAQLISENPNVLLIFDSFLWHLDNKELFYANFINSLEETVNQFTNISAVIIYIEKYYHPDIESSVIKGRNYLIIQEYDAKLLKLINKLIILNEFANHPLLPHEIEKLKQI